MAYTTKSGIQVRNFMLTEALHLEGELDWNKPPAMLFFGEATVDGILAADPITREGADCLNISSKAMVSHT